MLYLMLVIHVALNRQLVFVDMADGSVLNTCQEIAWLEHQISFRGLHSCHSSLHHTHTIHPSPR